MNDVATTYAGAGAYVITCSMQTSNTWTKSHFASRGLNNMYNFQGSNLHTNVWSNYGSTWGTNPYKVVIDRDGFLRFSGSDVFGADEILLECLGAS